MSVITRAVAPRVPPRYLGPVHDVVYRVRRRRYHGTAHQCPICESRIASFVTAWESTPPRSNVRCPVCGSRPRHRLVWRFLIDRTDLAAVGPQRVLHVAPEFQFARRLKSLPNVDYVSADLESPLADLKLDLTDIPLSDGSFDVILCSHVLEHIPDDRKAMSELCRVLRPGGWMIPQVPIAIFGPSGEFRRVVEGSAGAFRELVGASTFEDWSVTSPADRERVFGQFDHVRIYGPDFRDRLEAAGFDVTVDPYARSLDPAVTDRLGIDRDEDIYFCRKPDV